MSLNVPSFDTNDFSFGPGVLYLGAAGATPTADVGAITEDGITISPENETRDIMQGNPKQIIYTFNQQQGVVVETSGIEWDFTTLARALGAGNTTVSGSEETLVFGGQPLTEKVAIHIEHQMAVTGNTLDAYIWQAVSNGAPTMPFIHDEHNFDLSWKAQRVTTDWAGNTLDSEAELMKVVRTL